MLWPAQLIGTRQDASFGDVFCSRSTNDSPAAGVLTLLSLTISFALTRIIREKVEWR